MTDAARDKYLQRKYGITLQDYKQMAAKTSNTCWICGRPPKEGGKSLHTDHDHKQDKIKLEYGRGTSKVWFAFNPANQSTLNKGIFYGRTKSEAGKQAKKATKGIAVRGLLCWQCNTGLKKWNDNPELLEAAAKYLKSYQARLNGQEVKS